MGQDRDAAGPSDMIENEPGTQPGATPAASVRRGERAERFFVNVLWNWIALGAAFFTAFFLTRFIIHTVGEERYGLWALGSSLIEYFSLFDLGLRSAVVNFASRYRAHGDLRRLNQVLNTALWYFLVVGALLFAMTIALSGQVHRFLAIQDQHRDEFSQLIRVTGIGLSASIAFCVFQAGLEAFQSFRVYNHIAIVAMVMRALGWWAVLAWGYGIVAMAWVVVLSQCTAYAMNAIALRRVFPHLRFSLSLIDWARLREMVSYGVPSFIANSSTLVLTQGPPLLVGHFYVESFVGYYNLPMRLLQYCVDGVTRIGFVTAPNTAEMMTLGKSSQVARLGMYLNRYCLSLFLPFALYLVLYGQDLIGVWIGERFAAMSSPLLLPFAMSASLAMAAQFNSSSILFGMGRHRGYALGLVVESIVMVAALCVVIPRAGIVGAAWVSAGLMILNRGIAVPWMVSRYLDVSFARFMKSIYVPPLACLVPVASLMVWLHANALPGANWSELVAALGFTVMVYYGLACVFSVEAEHRTMLWKWIAMTARRIVSPALR